MILVFVLTIKLGFKQVHTAYHMGVTGTPLLNKNPPTENFNTTPVKNPYSGLKLVRIGQIVAKI